MRSRVKRCKMMIFTLIVALVLPIGVSSNYNVYAATEDSVSPSVIVYNGEQLVQAIEDAEDGDVIGIGRNIELASDVDVLGNDDKQITIIKASEIAFIQICNSENMVVRNIIFDGNSSIYNQECNPMVFVQGNTDFTNVTFQNCYNQWSGGALRIDSGNVNLTDCRFDNNYAFEGAHIRVNAPANVIASNCVLKNGIAGQSGGAIIVEYNIGSGNDAKIELDNCLITDNKARYGGAIANKGILKINNSIIYGNTAINAADIINFEKASSFEIESLDDLMELYATVNIRPIGWKFDYTVSANMGDFIDKDNPLSAMKLEYELIQQGDDENNEESDEATNTDNEDKSDTDNDDSLENPADDDSNTGNEEKQEDDTTEDANISDNPTDNEQSEETEKPTDNEKPGENDEDNSNDTPGTPNDDDSTNENTTLGENGNQNTDNELGESDDTPGVSNNGDSTETNKPSVSEGSNQNESETNGGENESEKNDDSSNSDSLADNQNTADNPSNKGENATDSTNKDNNNNSDNSSETTDSQDDNEAMQPNNGNDVISNNPTSGDSGNEENDNNISGNTNSEDIANTPTSNTEHDSNNPNNQSNSTDIGNHEDNSGELPKPENNNVDSSTSKDDDSNSDSLLNNPAVNGNDSTSNSNEEAAITNRVDNTQPNIGKDSEQKNKVTKKKTIKKLSIVAKKGKRKITGTTVKKASVKVKIGKKNI